jgi:aminopeptidase N
MTPCSTRRPLVAVAAAGALLASLLTGGGAVASVSRPTPGSPGAGDPYYPLYGNGGYEVRDYHLDARYNPASGLLQGRTRILARATQDLSRFDLDLVGFTVRSITVDGARATWTRQPHELVVRPGATLRNDHTFTVVIAYDGTPAPFRNPSGEVVGGFLKTPDGGIAVGEPEVAAQWFPVNDHPSDKATYRISLTVPRQFEAVSNGLPGRRSVRGDWATTTWRTRDPMVSYLAFLAVGHFTVHRWRTSYGLPIIDAIDSGITGTLRRRIEASLSKQGDIIAAESRWFGPYPFEAAGGVIDEVDIGFALENQTRPTYDPTFWDGPDAPRIGDDVVVHELAHQWYGDSVALRRWEDIWLNEGFATYAEWLWSEHIHSFTPQQLFDQNYESLPAGDRFWTLKIGDPGPDAQFAHQVYLRGGMTLQALRMTVGTDAFFRILRTWAHDRRNGHGTTPEFIALAERISGKSLDALFRAWLFTPAKPPRPTTSAETATTAAVARSAQTDAAIERWTTGVRARLAR